MVSAKLSSGEMPAFPRGNDGVGRLGALNDRRIGAVLNLVLGDVNHDWQIDELTSAVGMSRSGLAFRFKELVGIPPLGYLTRWRSPHFPAALLSRTPHTSCIRRGRVLCSDLHSNSSFRCYPLGREAKTVTGNSFPGHFFRYRQR